MFDISSDTFKNNKEWTKFLYWPVLWDIKGTVQKFKVPTVEGKGPHSWKFEKDVKLTKIYISNSNYFEINLRLPEITYKHNSTDAYSNPYFTSLHFLLLIFRLIFVEFVLNT
jgi:hypothetical protein